MVSAPANSAITLSMQTNTQNYCKYDDMAPNNNALFFLLRQKRHAAANKVIMSRAGVSKTKSIISVISVNELVRIDTAQESIFESSVVKLLFNSLSGVEKEKRELTHKHLMK